MENENTKKNAKKFFKPSTFVWLIILAGIVAAGFSSFYTVDETEQAVITRLENTQRLLEPDFIQSCHLELIKISMCR